MSVLTVPASGVAFDDLDLHAATRAALTDMGVVTPTPIQARALPPLLDRRDVVGQARTGSGKTLAFAIPAMEHVDPRVRQTQVLVLVPTRELAVQVASVLDALGDKRGLTSSVLVGGRGLGPQITSLRRSPAIVVGTPGRVLDLLNQGYLHLNALRLLVLDEADEMLDRGFAPDVERIIRTTNSDRQTALFSATVPDWVATTAKRYLREPVNVMVDPTPEQAAPVDHFAYDLPTADKLPALRALLDERGDGAMIVFGRTKHGVKKLAARLQADGYPVAALQGNLSQNARDRVMEAFRSGEAQILVATNVAARGLDISHVETVVNVELPESPELLTHRIGRTGRMGRHGQAITLLAPEDGAKWRQLEHGLGRRIPRRAWSQRDGASSTPQPRRTPVAPAPTSVAAPVVADRPRALPRTAPSPRLPEHTTHLPHGRPPRREPVAREQAGPVRTTVVCAACGGPAIVPFVPRTARPVYCSSCFTRSGRIA